MKFAGRINGVAARHERESRRIWRDLWSGRDPAQVPNGHVTNGVHLGTWMAQRLRTLLAEHLGNDWETRRDEPGFWDRVLEIDDEKVWRVHERLKQLLHSYIREDARTAGATTGVTRRSSRWPGPCSARRRSHRLRAAVRDLQAGRPHPQGWRAPAPAPGQPEAAGPAGLRRQGHPADEPGKGVLQRVYLAAQDPQYMGRVAFIEDYELHLAHRLVQGVDLWMNLPRVPMEACGTSGMKAALNGVPQLSTLDGWWAEGFTGGNGWAIPLAPPDEDVDEADINRLFELLEDEVVPRFYERDARGIPVQWVAMMKQAIRTAGERFTARRMLQDYVRDYYIPPRRANSPTTTRRRPEPMTPTRPAFGVLHLTAELWPYARTGGLGQAVADLAAYQVRSGVQASVLMPLYRMARGAHRRPRAAGRSLHRADERT